MNSYREELFLLAIQLQNAGAEDLLLVPQKFEALLSRIYQSSISKNKFRPVEDQVAIFAIRIMAILIHEGIFANKELKEEVRPLLTGWALKEHNVERPRLIEFWVALQAVRDLTMRPTFINNHLVTDHMDNIGDLLGFPFYLQMLAGKRYLQAISEGIGEQLPPGVANIIAISYLNLCPPQSVQCVIKNPQRAEFIRLIIRAIKEGIASSRVVLPLSLRHLIAGYADLYPYLSAVSYIH